MLVSNSSTISYIHIYSFALEKGALSTIGINDKVQDEFVNIITPGGKKFSTEQNVSQITTIPPPA